MKTLSLFAAVIAVVSFPVSSFAQCGSGGCGSGGMGCGGMMMSRPMMQMQHSGGVQIASNSPWSSSSPQSVIDGRIGVDVLVNAERARHGLTPVKVTAELNAEAQRIANEHAKNHKMEGVSTKFGRGAAATGSNDVNAIVRAWAANQKISQNLLATDYTTCGYARAVGSDGQAYWVLVMGGNNREAIP